MRREKGMILRRRESCRGWDCGSGLRWVGIGKMYCRRIEIGDEDGHDHDVMAGQSEQHLILSKK